MLAKSELVKVLRRMASRVATRSEADLQSDVRALLLFGGLELVEEGVVDVELEKHAGPRRIDVQAGCALIEVKKDLSPARVAEKAIEQLSDYVQRRTEETGQRYVGILTDGADWRLYHLETDGTLAQASTFRVDAAAPDLDGLLIWIEGVLATRTAIPPIPDEIERRLGASSSAFALDKAELLSLYVSCRQLPEVELKRELYAKLLTTAFGTQFANEDELFVEHTLLVVMAELIAHVVLGVSITAQEATPGGLLGGDAFHAAEISGVVEEDFFDWVLDAPGGESWIRSLARRIGRFAWKQADHDVLKVLYESIIDAKQRHRLGEYYTPDWLAERVVGEVITEPLSMRVADVSCGSGTFLYHAIRHHLAAADSASLTNSDAIRSVVGHVYGVDVHPVAVTLARVTYLLAIGAARLEGDRTGFAVPVYLGDAVQWRHEESLLSEGQVAIRTSAEGNLFSEELRFPESILADADRFDRLVSELTDGATDPRRVAGQIPPITTLLNEHGIQGSDRSLVEETFRHLCALHDEGRDHIWGYFVRNLVRPVWLASRDHRLDALVGNPPWLAFRFMTPVMQRSFRQLSLERGLWGGSKVATHQDLSALFVARAIELYLRPGGRFGYVMPEAVLSRIAYAGFRKGEWQSGKSQVRVTFDEPWSFGRIKPPIFRVPSCVVYGSAAAAPTSMPNSVLKWEGRRPPTNASWQSALTTMSSTSADVATAAGTPRSPYHEYFRQGASIVPRMLWFVTSAPAVGLLGTAGGRRRVTSHRDVQEKQPWKGLPSITAAVEPRFVRPVHLGRTLLPFRCLEPLEAIIPADGHRVLQATDSELSRYPGLADWLHQADDLWMRHRTSERLSLTGRLDYQRNLSLQLPGSATRVIYAASGQYLAAARVDDPSVVVDTKLYWKHCGTTAEADYLTAILNSPTVTRRLEPLQSRGEHNPRDFHKLVFQLPIPRFESGNDLHRKIATLGATAQAFVATLELPELKRFEALRRHVREALGKQGILAELDHAVDELLDGPADADQEAVPAGH